MSLADMGTATRGGAAGSGGGGGGGVVGLDMTDAAGVASVGGRGGLAGGRMTHSLSTPSGVDGTPSTPRHRGGKKLTVRIQMLDDSVTMFQVQVSAAAFRHFCYYSEKYFCQKKVFAQLNAWETLQKCLTQNCQKFCYFL